MPFFRTLNALIDGRGPSDIRMYSRVLKWGYGIIALLIVTQSVFFVLFRGEIKFGPFEISSLPWAGDSLAYTAAVFFLSYFVGRYVFSSLTATALRRGTVPVKKILIYLASALMVSGIYISGALAGNILYLVYGNPLSLISTFLLLIICRSILPTVKMMCRMVELEPGEFQIFLN